MLEPMAKACVVAPAASEALFSSCRYSRASEYSLWNNTNAQPNQHSHHTQLCIRTFTQMGTATLPVYDIMTERLEVFL